MVSIYTDGSCLKNPNGPGGWAFCCVMDTLLFCDAGSHPETTNNRMELQAVLEAISFMSKELTYVIHTDSQLTINCAIGKWSRKANLDLWSQYDKLSKEKQFEFKYVKAHNGDTYNELVDKLAKEQAYKV